MAKTYEQSFKRKENLLLSDRNPPGYTACPAARKSQLALCFIFDRPVLQAGNDIHLRRDKGRLQQGESRRALGRGAHECAQDLRKAETGLQDGPIPSEIA